MDERERLEWQKAVNEVVRSERRKRQRHDRIRHERLKILDSRAYNFANPQKKQEMQDSALSIPLSAFGLRKKKGGGITSRNYSPYGQFNQIHKWISPTTAGFPKAPAVIFTM